MLFDQSYLFVDGTMEHVTAGEWQMGCIQDIGESHN